MNSNHYLITLKSNLPVCFSSLIEIYMQIHIKCPYRENQYIEKSQYIEKKIPIYREKQVYREKLKKNKLVFYSLSSLSQAKLLSS